MVSFRECIFQMFTVYLLFKLGTRCMLKKSFCKSDLPPFLSVMKCSKSTVLGRYFGYHHDSYLLEKQDLSQALSGLRWP